MKTSAAESGARAAPVDSVSRFRAWLSQAQPGATVEYHRGHLLWDRAPEAGLDRSEQRALRRVADAALDAARRGQVHLVQQRHGEFDFSYLAVKAGTSMRRKAARLAAPPARAAA